MTDVESVLDSADRIEGYFQRAEGRLLYETTLSVLTRLPGSAIVELGSYCGKSTVILGKAAQRLGTSKVYAIDPHEGEVMFPEGLHRNPPTLDRFVENIARHELSGTVELIKQRSYQVRWDKPIGLLLIDALHDYANVSRDFRHFSQWIPFSGVVAFHDYELNDHRGVTQYVNELLAAGQGYKKEKQVDSLIILRNHSLSG